MDFNIQEFSEETNPLLNENGLEFSIEEVVEEVNITIEEYHGADGIDGIKGDKPNHQWNGTSLRFENPDDTWGNYVDLKGDKGEDGGGLMSVVAGDNITIDNTDPLNPIINAEDGGTTVTKTSDLVNDGADGINPYISLNDIPIVDISTKAEVDASNLTPTNVISWRNALDIYSKSQVDTALALKLDKPTAPNNIAERVINADGSTSPNGNFSRTLQVKVSASTAAQEDWKGKLVLVTASCTIIIPTGLSDSWGCDIATLAGVTLTWAITSPKTWLFGTPPTLPEKSMCSIAQDGATNSIMLFGGYGI